MTKISNKITKRLSLRTCAFARLFSPLRESLRREYLLLIPVYENLQRHRRVPAGKKCGGDNRDFRRRACRSPADHPAIERDGEKRRRRNRDPYFFSAPAHGAASRTKTTFAQHTVRKSGPARKS